MFQHERGGRDERAPDAQPFETACESRERDGE
jgi:hypothetical protein